MSVPANIIAHEVNYRGEGSKKKKKKKRKDKNGRWSHGEYASGGGCNGVICH